MNIKPFRMIAALLTFISILLSVLTGCSPALKNPYKGQGVVIELSTAEYLNSADTPSGQLGDSEHFVVRVVMNLYNMGIPSLGGSDQKPDKQIMELLTSKICCIETGDHPEFCFTGDSSNLEYSQRGKVIKNVILYYLIPAQYKDDLLRFAVYDSTDTISRQILFETSDFDKSEFSANLYGKQNDPSAQTPPVSESEHLPHIEGVVYDGFIQVPFAEKLYVRCIFSQDLSVIEYVEILVENLHVQVKEAQSVGTYEIGKSASTSRPNMDIKDGKVSFGMAGSEFELMVLDSCIYGKLHYKFEPTSSDTQTIPDAIDLGIYDVVLENRTTPGQLPENISELLKNMNEDE